MKWGCRRRLQPKRMPTVRQRSFLDRASLHVLADGIGFRRCPAKVGFLFLRLYSPLEPFFTKEWNIAITIPRAGDCGPRALWITRC